MFARALVLWARGRGTTRASLFGSIAIPFAFAASLLALVPAMRWAGFLPAGLVFAFGWMLTRVNGLAVGAADVPHHPRLPSEGPGAG